MTDEKKKTTPQEDPVSLSAGCEAEPSAEDGGKPLTEKITFKGAPVFKSLDIDPKTGNIIGGETTDEIREKMGEVVHYFSKNLDTIFDNLQLFPDLLEALQEYAEKTAPAREVFDTIQELEPYISEELKKPEYNGATIESILNQYELTDLPAAVEDPTLKKIIEAAKEAKAKTLLAHPYNADKMLLPTDKINLFAWDLRETGGQIKFDLSRAGSGDEATALFSLAFDDDPNVKITKEINHFDKRVMSVVGTAFNSGHPIISATGIYYAMGGTGKPAAATIARIDKSLTTLDMGKVFINNQVEANKYNYDEVKKEDRLLHFKRVTAISNGKLSDTFIQILEEPFLMTFARQRKQISAVPMKVLQSPVSKTNNHLRIEDYLLWRIVQQKNDIKKLQEKQEKKYTQQRQRQIKEAAKLTILLKTLYEHTGLIKKDTTAKKRALKTVEDYLKHYKSEAAGQWIGDYKLEKDKIIITLPIK